MYRRSVAVAALVLVLAAPAAASDPSARAQVAQAAFASWSANEDGARVMYFAAGINGLPGSWPSRGVIGRAPCKKMAHRGHTYWHCRGRQKLLPLMPGQFIMDPALMSAQLQIATDDGTDSASWQGLGDSPVPFVHQHAGTDVGVQVIAALMRRANLSATISGIATEGKRRGQLMQGFGVDVWLYGGAVRTPVGTFRLDDGVVEFRTRFSR